jgi:hypothetical protein
MIEEKYQNGDIYWNTYSGKFKMFDKDGNEIPCEYLEQLAKRLEQERDELLEEIKQLHNGRSTEELYTLFGKPIKYWEELEQENKSNKELLIIAQNEAMEAQFDREKYKDALEEIRIMATKDVSIESFVKIQNKINEVLR